MILKTVNFYENKGKPDYWAISDVELTAINALVGLNATGKTRLINLVSNLAKVISKKVPKAFNGHWELEFSNDLEKELYNYRLEMSQGVVKEEGITKNHKVLLRRSNEDGEIYSHTQRKLIPFAPPQNELTLHVRRDKKEHPFLEELYEWASNFHSYSFTNQDPRHLLVAQSNVPTDMLENLGAVPYLLSEALKNPDIKKRIIEDFSRIGYPIKNISAEKQTMQGIGVNVLLVVVQEPDLKCPTSQLNMSQGMFSALSLIVIIEHILSTNQQCTIAIDDLGEGLDFQRSFDLIKLLVEKVRGSNIQLIVTSNNRFLINAVDIKQLNLLEREGHVVRAFNYTNEKKRFDEFELTGLNSFDFFSQKMYKDKND